MHDQLSPSEKSRFPWSFVVFMLNLGAIGLSGGLSIAASSFDWNMKYAPATILPMIFGILLLSSGLYAGLTYRSPEPRHVRLNKIGMWGSGVMLAVFVLGILTTTFVQLFR